MNDLISIELFRISGSSKELYMIFNCNDIQHFHFASLHLEVRFLEKGIFKSKFFDLSSALFGNQNQSRDHWTVKLPLEKLGISYPAIYIGTLIAAPNDPNQTNPCGCSDPTDTCLKATMVCSDVNGAYRCILNDLLKEERCDSVSEDAIRKYLLLYGHQAALTAQDLETAELYFKLMGDCTNACSNNHSVAHTQPCNCGR